jgi:hypothetical protein
LRFSFFFFAASFSFTSFSLVSGFSDAPLFSADSPAS